MPPGNLSWDTVLTFIQKLGWTKGVFTLFFFIAHYWVFKLYNGRLEDRQGEIDRLAEDNRAYRERYLAKLDDHFKYSPADSSTKAKAPTKHDPRVKN